MILQQAERLFLRLVEPDDEDLQSLVDEWEPYYQHRNNEYGNELIEGFKEYSIDPCLSATAKHSQVISMGIAAASAADVQAAADAFICAIAINDAQRVRWLIPLRAISNTLHLPKHRYIDDDGRCEICGEKQVAKWTPMTAVTCLRYGDCGEDWQVLNNVMMVRWFNQSEPPTPSRTDAALFKAVLKFIADAEPDTRAYKLAKLIKKQFKGQEETWRVFFETLGFAGVLKTDKQPGHLQTWTNMNRRAPPTGQGDARSPMCYWQRSSGFDAAVFKQLFPKFSLPKPLIAKDA